MRDSLSLSWGSLAWNLALSLGFPFLFYPFYYGSQFHFSLWRKEQFSLSRFWYKVREIPKGLLLFSTGLTPKKSRALGLGSILYCGVAASGLTLLQWFPEQGSLSLLGLHVLQGVAFGLGLILLPLQGGRRAAFTSYSFLITIYLSLFLFSLSTQCFFGQYDFQGLIQKQGPWWGVGYLPLSTFGFFLLLLMVHPQSLLYFKREEGGPTFSFSARGPVNFLLQIGDYCLFFQMLYLFVVLFWGGWSLPLFFGAGPTLLLKMVLILIPMNLATQIHPFIGQERLAILAWKVIFPLAVFSFIGVIVWRMVMWSWP